MKLKYFVFFAGMAMLLVCLNVQALAAEIEDASFEDNGAGYWNGWDSKGFKRNFDALDEAKSGDQSYQVVASGVVPAWGAAIASQILAENVTGGDKFETSVWTKIPKNNDGSKTIGLKNAQAYLETIFYDGNGYEEANEVKKFKSQDYKEAMDWTKIAISDEVPKGAADCKVQLVVNSPTGGKVLGNVYFDDVSFEIKNKKQAF